MMSALFFLHYRLVYIEVDIAVSRHIKTQTEEKKKLEKNNLFKNKNTMKIFLGGEKREYFRGLGIAVHAVVHRFSIS